MKKRKKEIKFMPARIVNFFKNYKLIKRTEKPYHEKKRSRKR